MTDDRPRAASSQQGRGATRRGDDPLRRRQARQEIASVGEPSPRFDATASQGRRLSAAERQALRERHQARRGPVVAAPPRRRKRVTAAPDTSRSFLVVGALLMAGLATLAFAGGRLFGSAEERPAGTTVAARDAGTPPARSLTEVHLLGIASGATPSPLASPATSAQTGTVRGRIDGRQVVCIDPGHGGSDRGFVRQDNGNVGRMEEAPLTLQQAWDLEARLQQRGVSVVMTRDDDVEVNRAAQDVNGDGKTAKDDKPGTNFYKNLDELQARINVCNGANADLLVSLHVNGVPLRPEVGGYETWYTADREFGDVNARFATLAFRALGEQMEAVGYAATPREVNDDKLADVEPEHGGSTLKHMIITGPAVPGLVTPSAMPGAIVEALFITNDADARFLASPLGQHAIVSAYEAAVIQYFEEFPA